MATYVSQAAAKRIPATVVEIIRGNTTAAPAIRSDDLAPSENENRVDDARKRGENALRADPLDVRRQYEKQLLDLQETYGEAMPEFGARKRYRPSSSGRTTIDPDPS